MLNQSVIYIQNKFTRYDHGKTYKHAYGADCNTLAPLLTSPVTIIVLST